MILPRAVVFLGGSATEVELIQAFRRNDVRVVLVDRNADAPGRPFADEFVNLSVTDVDSICAAMEAYRSRYCFVAAYGVVDYMFDTIGVLTERLNIKLNSPEIYREFTNKLNTKERCAKFDVAAPRTILRGRQFDESVAQSVAAAGGSGRVVIKASDACDSEGVQIVRADQRISVRQAICRAIEVSGEFYCEEYIGGTLHNLDVILDAGGPFTLAITDRYRMADGITSIGGLQQNPRRHALYGEFEELAVKMQRMFSDYRGPLTGDILNSDGKLTVLEMSPHLHVSKLQWLRDPSIADFWPRILSGQTPDVKWLKDDENASAYVRIYGVESAYHDYFDSTWIVEVEEFFPPRHFGPYELHKILYMRARSAPLLRERLEAFVRYTGGSPMIANYDPRVEASP
jgi:biotin carboxylase